MNGDPQKRSRTGKRLLVLGAAILGLLLVNVAVPRKKVLPQLSARTLKDLAELATVEYSVTKIVSYKDVAWYGDRKILFETAAIVKAGINLNELSDSDPLAHFTLCGLFQPRCEGGQQAPESLRRLKRIHRRSVIGLEYVHELRRRSLEVECVDVLCEGDRLAPYASGLGAFDHLVLHAPEHRADESFWRRW